MSDEKLENLLAEWSASQARREAAGRLVKQRLNEAKVTLAALRQTDEFETGFQDGRQEGQLEGFCAGAAVAFGLLGMAHAIAERERRKAETERLAQRMAACFGLMGMAEAIGTQQREKAGNEGGQ